MAASKYKINHEQRNHLHDRINAVRTEYGAKLRVPKAVERARRIVAEFDAKARKHESDAYASWRKRITETREAIAFLGPDEALAAVKKLEAEAQRRRAR